MGKTLDRAGTQSPAKESQWKSAKIRFFIFKHSVIVKQELEAVWQEQEMSECRGKNE